MTGPELERVIALTAIASATLTAGFVLMAVVLGASIVERARDRADESRGDEDE